MLAGDRFAHPFSLYSAVDRLACQEPVITFSDFFLSHTKMTDYKERMKTTVKEKQVGEVS